MGRAMTAGRLIPLPTHAAMEMVLGLTLMVAPFLAGLTTAGIVAGVVIGALVVGLALQAVVDDGSGLPLSAHRAADVGIALGLAGAAIVMAPADTAATVLFGAVALAQLALVTATRYGHRR
jgi:hypothetical protein